MSVKTRLSLFKNDWKLFFHLLFRTKHFGVNNLWWSDFPSIFGWPWWKILFALVTIRPLIYTYREIKFRAKACKFVSKETLEVLGWNK